MIDLPNYEAEAAEGSSMEAMGIKMINASRTYESDDSELTATIVISNKIQDTKMLEDVEVESDEAGASIKTINGFKVTENYSKEDKEGAIMIFIAENETLSGFFSINYEGISKEDALDLAKKFDWSQIKTKVEKLLQ